MQPDMWIFMTGFAISEITETEAKVPRSEAVIPEKPIVREPSNQTETDTVIKEMFTIPTDTSRYSDCLNYPLEVVIPSLCPAYRSDCTTINDKTREVLARKFSFSINTRTGANQTGEVIETPSVRCYYLGGSNHTVPHIAIGEQVEVRYYRGNDTFYWRELGRDNNLRHTEKYRVFVSDQDRSDKTADADNKNVNRPNDDNTYYVEFDTINGHVLLSTANTNGEPCRFFTKYNTKEGTFTGWDTEGNRIYINSLEHRISLSNAEQSVVELHKGHCNIWTPSSITLESDTINLLGRVNTNDVCGLDGKYKSAQVDAKEHTRDVSGNILSNGSVAPMTGTGIRTVRTSTTETTMVPTKVDIINTWDITNTSFTFKGNILSILGTTLDETMKNVSLKNETVVTIGTTLTVTIPTTVWTGKITQSPAITVKDITCTGRARGIL